METSLYPQHQLPSPTSHSSSSSSNSQPRSDPTTNNPYPTTFVQADTASFKQVVQMLTGSPRPTTTTTNPSAQPDPPFPSGSSTRSIIPPIKSIPNKKTSSSTQLYERRNSLKNFKINPIFAPSGSGSGFKPGEILSPSILDFPSLALSPVTPLIPDPFDRSATTSSEEERAIKEKGFYFHPSPATTPRDASAASGEPPRLLPLFPVTSPRVSSGSSANIPSPSS